MTLCRQCRLEKEETAFTWLDKEHTSRRTVCKRCSADRLQRYRAKNPAQFRTYESRRTPEQVKARRLRTTYQISLDAYFQMWADQGGRCVCGDFLAMDWSEVHVDHDHTCCAGKKSCGQCVRGLLCPSCNSTLGYARDDVTRLRCLADYVEDHKQKKAANGAARGEEERAA